MVVAYEPIWAIGTGRAATAEQAEQVCGWIRDMVNTLYGTETAQRMRILYGGSVTPDIISPTLFPGRTSMAHLSAGQA
jgi:triosephosphate isomerase